MQEDECVKLTIGDNMILGYCVSNEKNLPPNEKNLPPFHIGLIQINEDTHYFDEEQYLIKYLDDDDDDDIFDTRFYIEYDKKNKIIFKIYTKPYNIKHYLNVSEMDIVEFVDKKHANKFKIMDNYIVNASATAEETTHETTQFILNYKFRTNQIESNDEESEKYNTYIPHYLSIINKKYAKKYVEEHKPVSIIYSQIQDRAPTQNRMITTTGNTQSQGRILAIR